MLNGLSTIAQGFVVAAESQVTPQDFNPPTVALGIGVLFGLAFLSMVIAWWRTWHWDDEEAVQKLRGLALPSGTTRSVLALLVVGGFVLFAFIGFTAVLGFIYVRLTERKRNE